MCLNKHLESQGTETTKIPKQSCNALTKERIWILIQGVGGSYHIPMVPRPGAAGWRREEAEGLS